MKKIGILDYCVFSNKVHLKNILENLMCKVEYVSDPRRINDYDILICPGLGSFAKSINLLKKKNFIKQFKICILIEYFLEFVWDFKCYSKQVMKII